MTLTNLWSTVSVVDTRNELPQEIVELVPFNITITCNRDGKTKYLMHKL